MKLYWRELIISLFLSVTLWYGIAGSDKIESEVSVRVDYRGVPSNLIVCDGQISRISVRFRASVGMMRSIHDRDSVLFMDLSSLTSGKNVLSILPKQLPFGNGVEIIDISPSQIQLDVDTLLEKNLPVIYEPNVNLPEDYTLGINLTPKTVTVRGPKSVLGELTNISLPISLDTFEKNKLVEGITRQTLSIFFPKNSEVKPSQVVTTITVSIKRKKVVVTKPLLVKDKYQNRTLLVSPKTVTITAEIPESKAFIKNIEAKVNIPDTNKSSFVLPITVDLPDNSRLISVDPAGAIATVEKVQEKKE